MFRKPCLFVFSSILAACSASTGDVPGDDVVVVDALVDTNRHDDTESPQSDTQDPVGPCGAIDGCGMRVHNHEEDAKSVDVQRFRVVASSPDGSRIAVLYSHFGPSSRAPIVNLIAYEAEAPAALLHENLFVFDANAYDEAALQALETQVLSDNTAALAALGVVPGDGMATSEPWCATVTTLCTQDVGYTFDVTSNDCATVAGTTEGWRLCRDDAPGHCAGGPPHSPDVRGYECGWQDPRPVDVQRVGARRWVFFETAHALDGEEPFRFRSVGAAPL